jgi:hypothetical protein
MREALEQSADFPLVENASLPKSPEIKQRIGVCVTICDEFQQPHFSCAKSCYAGGQLFEQVKQGWPQQRQGAQILAHQFETSFGSRGGKVDEIRMYEFRARSACQD